jgi:hypothetical protein
MARQKGIPKTGGRAKGTPNRTTDEVRASLLKLLDKNLTQLQKDIDSMKGKDRAALLVNLAKHCTPPAVNPERLTEEQLLQIIQYIKRNEVLTPK